MKIINLTQHVATPEQKAAGVFDVSPEHRKALQEALTFDAAPTRWEIKARAARVVRIMKAEASGDNSDCAVAMLGGAPWLMYDLQAAVKEAGFEAVYAFSQRRSVEKMVDGKVVKTNEFVHAGFVWM